MHRRLRLPLLALALVALAAPAVALADAPRGAWQITGLVLDGQKIAANGKLTLSDQVAATVGCNSMSGPYTIDGATITIGSLSTTLIGCPGDVGQAENALMKILSSGPVTIAADKWTSAAGEIDLVDASGANPGGGGSDPGCIPPVAPGANPPDNVTVPCGSGGSGSTGGNGSTIDTTGPATPTDPTTPLFVLGVGVLLVATIGAFVYLGPRKASGGPEQ